jgi:WD40 repeat protein
MRLIRYISIGLLGAALPALTENAGPVSGPMLGYVKKSDGIRPLLGVPGAAYFAPALQLDGFETAAVCSEHGYAVLLTPDRMTVRIIALHSAEPIAVFAGLGSAVNSVYFSADGKTVALARERNIDILSGLPTSPAYKKTIETLPGALAMAVSDDGEAVAVFEGNSIVMIDADGQRQIATARALYDIRFRQGSRDVIYTDGDSVMVASSEGVRMIAGIADDLSSARTALFSRDGRTVVIAGIGSQDLLIAQSSGGVSERVKLPCFPGELTSINDSTFRLRCQTGDQIHLVQLTPNGTRVLFVPEPVE